VLRQAGGFIKSPPPDERVPSIAPLREVLAACFVHGGSNLVVVADRSRQVEAEELMGRFAGTHIASSLILRPSPVGATRDPAEIEGPQFRRAMVVTLPSATLDGPERGQQTEVLLPGAEAAIRVRLSLPLSLVTPSDQATPELLSWMSRSGGFADVTRPRLQSPGRGLLRSMLAAPGLDQELQYLFANGMRGTVIEGLDAALAETSSRYGVRMLEQGVGSKSQ
ncbi:MAG: hypothetical protein L3K04_08065, partial [Thermoplasmata archaeon]|nr:hypothetical protein [Thermoplasmata archaeon]